MARVNSYSLVDSVEYDDVVLIDGATRGTKTITPKRLVETSGADIGGDNIPIDTEELSDNDDHVPSSFLVKSMFTSDRTAMDDMAIDIGRIQTSLLDVLFKLDPFVEGNIPIIDNTGALEDSGFKPSDFVSSTVLDGYVPLITGTSDPQNTQASVGTLMVNTDNLSIHALLNITSGVYSWKKLATTQEVNAALDSKMDKVTGTGISDRIAKFNNDGNVVNSGKTISTSLHDSTSEVPTSSVVYAALGDKVGLHIKTRKPTSADAGVLGDIFVDSNLNSLYDCIKITSPEHGATTYDWLRIPQMSELSAAPTSSTEGAIGNFAFDETNGEYYYLSNIITAQNITTYDWQKLTTRAALNAKITDTIDTSSLSDSNSKVPSSKLLLSMLDTSSGSLSDSDSKIPSSKLVKSSIQSHHDSTKQNDLGITSLDTTTSGLSNSDSTVPSSLLVKRSLSNYIPANIPSYSAQSYDPSTDVMTLSNEDAAAIAALPTGQRFFVSLGARQAMYIKSPGSSSTGISDILRVPEYSEVVPNSELTLRPKLFTGNGKPINTPSYWNNQKLVVTDLYIDLYTGGVYRCTSIGESAVTWDILERNVLFFTGSAPPSTGSVNYNVGQLCVTSTNSEEFSSSSNTDLWILKQYTIPTVGTYSYQWEEIAKASDVAEKVTGKNITVYFGMDTSETTSVQIKPVTCEGFVLTDHATIFVKMANNQLYNGDPLLNVNSTGAKPIKIYGNVDAGRYHWRAGEVLGFTYDQTNDIWIMHNSNLADTSYYGFTKLYSGGAHSSSEAMAITPRALNYTVRDIINSAPVYSASSTYAVGDVVREEFGVYVCNTAISTPESWNSAHWTIMPTLQTQIDGKMDKVLSANTESEVPNGMFFDLHGSGEPGYKLANGNVYHLQRRKSLLSVTLAAANWDSQNKTITVTASGVTSSNTVSVSIAPSSIPDAAASQVYCSAQASDALTFTCMGDIPTNNITVNVIIWP